MTNTNDPVIRILHPLPDMVDYSGLAPITFDPSGLLETPGIFDPLAMARAAERASDSRCE